MTCSPSFSDWAHQAEAMTKAAAINSAYAVFNQRDQLAQELARTRHLLAQARAEADGLFADQTSREAYDG